MVLGNEMTGAVAEAHESDSGMGGAAKGQDLAQQPFQQPPMTSSQVYP